VLIGQVHVWTAPVEQGRSEGTVLIGQVHSCVRPVARGARPLAMMVSVDQVLIKLARYDAR
jgi:hypothetical protein